VGEPGDLRDGAFVIVPELNSILLVKHNYGEAKWSLPGGGIRFGELAIKAARRELAEETGITEVKTMWQIGIFTLRKRYGLVLLYEALGWFGCPRADTKEIAECRFFKPEKINDNIIYPAQLSAIEIYLKLGTTTPRLVYGHLARPPIIYNEGDAV